MTALEAIAVHVPPTAVPIEQVGADAGLERMQIAMFRRFYGLDEVRLDPDGSVSDLLRGAAAALEPLRGQEHRVRYVLYALANPGNVPYPVDPLNEVCREFGLEHAIACTVSHQACACGLLAIDVAGRLLAADGDQQALALILAGEKTFTRNARIAPQTSVFGETSAACLVRAGAGRDHLLSYRCIIRGEFDASIANDPERLSRYQRAYPELLAEVMHKALAAAGTNLDEIALILPHNVNRVSWRLLCKDIGFPLDRVLLDNVPILGHSFNADVFINHHTATSRGLLKPGDRYLVAAAGIGAVCSAMVFEH